LIRLISILKEIYIDEGIVKVPQEVLSKSKDAYDYIFKNLETLKTKSEGKNWDNPYIDSKFKDYFQLKDLKGQDLKVTIGFYNNPKDAGAGRMDTREDILLINLPFLTDVEDFETLIEHELVHAMDPKVRDVHVYDKIKSKGAEPVGSRLPLSKTDSTDKSEFERNYEKYTKSPWEFDAFTAPLVNTVKVNFAKIKSNPEKAKQYKILIINLLSDLKTTDIKNLETLMDGDKYKGLKWFFSKYKWAPTNQDKARISYYTALYNIKQWTTDEKLYKRFTSRLGKELS